MTRRALRAATFALFATAVSVAAPAPLRAQDVTCDRGDQEVRALEFRGNRAVSDDDLALHVRTTPSSWGRRKLHLWFAEKRCLNHVELARDVLRLKWYYRDRGFYSARVDTLVQPLGKSAVRVVFNINEGPPTRLVSYTISGLEGIRDSADIVHRLRLRVGQPFDLGLLVADMDTIKYRLRDAGYYHTDVFHAYERKGDTVLASGAQGDIAQASVGRGDTAKASIMVSPGKRARFGVPRLYISSVDDRPQQIKDPVVRRVLGISPGSLYSDHAIVEAQRNLFQLGAYRHIEVAPLPDSLQSPGDTIVVLAVRLTEDYMHQLDSEFGWATLDCGRVRLQYTDKNLLGSARRLELTGQASKIGYGKPLETNFTQDICTFGRTSDLVEDPWSLDFHYFIGATLRQPRLLGTLWVPTVSIYSERRGEFKAYLRSTQIGGDFSATRDVGDRMPFRLAYTFEYGQTSAEPPALCVLFNRCDPLSVRRITKLLPLGVASAALARVRTDNVVSPTRGLALRGEIRSSASRLLGTSDSLFFNKATGDIAWYRPFGWRNVLAFRLRAGAVVGRRLSLSDQLAFVPPQERLYAGGPTSVRGFQQNELGSLVYIARRTAVDSIVKGISGTDTTYSFSVSSNPDSIQSPDRTVPLGGNSLLVANFEYRIRDPFFFPDLLQYAIFLDGGDVWTRGKQVRKLKWTPGLGVRALTPVGPVQVNIGWNDYAQVPGSIFYNPDVNTLACATPGNTLTYTRGTSTGTQLVANDANAECRSDFTPPTRKRWNQKLVFTFSIGTEF